MAKREEAKKPVYRAAVPSHVELDRDDVRDVRGKRITQASVDAAVERGHRQFDAHGRSVGRPSLSARGGVSKQWSVRLPEELNAALLSQASRTSTEPSEVIREALRRYLDIAK